MPWRKGESGNPGGRPARTKEWREFADAAMRERGGWERIEAISMGKGRVEDQLPALKLMIEHAYGHAPQPLTGDLDGESQFESLSIIIQPPVSTALATEENQ